VSSAKPVQVKRYKSLIKYGNYLFRACKCIHCTSCKLLIINIFISAIPYIYMQASVLAIHKTYKFFALEGKPFLSNSLIKTPYFAV